MGTATDLPGGDDGPWGVAVFVARATPDDHVVAAGSVRRPVGTADAALGYLWPKEYLPRAGAFTAESVGRLERA